MPIIKTWLAINLVGSIIYVAYDAYKNTVEERKCRTIANLPRGELLKIAMTDPARRSDFETLSRCMSIELATKIVTDRWLINSGLISLRNAES